MTTSTLLGAQRPSYLHYWPLPENDPGVELRREAVRLISPDGALMHGVLWTPPNNVAWKTAVILTHPRGDFSVHYACPLLAAAGYAVLGFGTRYVGNDIDCLHHACAIDVNTAAAEMRARGAESVILLGNSGGGSLMCLTQQEHQCGDGMVLLAAHPGQGMHMGQTIDPSVADENDPTSVIPELDMFNPDNGWRPWPERCTYDKGWLQVYRQAQTDRAKRIDAVAKSAHASQAQAAARLKTIDKEKDSASWRYWRQRTVQGTYLTIYRTLANPAHLDLTIDPDDRPLGSIFANPDPLDANYGLGGLGRVMTTRGWLSTWSPAESKARVVDTIQNVNIPILQIHATGDSEIRLRDASAMRDAAGSTDVTYHDLKGADHYLTNPAHREEAMELVIEWIRERF
ncbi:MAG: hypothetical protein GKR90_27295 [Pseudomonadales bacterium]|nr:hypothetical protein [Pseudomonadales bacterium]